MSDFIFADDYRLEEGSTRKFYESFLKGFVHKHNNLTGVIQGFSSLILYDDQISQEVRDNAQQMQDSAKQATELNKVVLSAAGCGRCESGSIPLTDIWPYWESKAGDICRDAGVEWKANRRDGLPPVRGDRDKLTEIFTQLIRNAADAASLIPGGSVAVDIFPPGEASPGDRVDLFLRNSSAALDAAALREAFQPFATTRGADHFGLGLTLAAVLAGQMDMRLGLCHGDATTTAWLSMPPAG